VEVELAQQRPGRPALVGRQLLLGKPGPALAAEQVGRRAARHQVAVQDRRHLVLQPRALANDVGPAGHLAAQRMRLVVGQPHRRQVVGGQQLGQHLGVDLVGLDPVLGDRPRLLRVRHHHPGHPRLEQLRDRVRVAARLDRHLVARRQAVGEHLSSSGVVPICRTWRTRPSSQTAT
jgi:hypothetical protein